MKSPLWGCARSGCHAFAVLNNPRTRAARATPVGALSPFFFSRGQARSQARARPAGGGSAAPSRRARRPAGGRRRVPGAGARCYAFERASAAKRNARACVCGRCSECVCARRVCVTVLISELVCESKRFQSQTYSREADRGGRALRRGRPQGAARRCRAAHSRPRPTAARPAPRRAAPNTGRRGAPRGHRAATGRRGRRRRRRPRGAPALGAPRGVGSDAKRVRRPARRVRRADGAKVNSCMTHARAAGLSLHEHLCVYKTPPPQV